MTEASDIYCFSASDISGRVVNFSDYRGKILLIVRVRATGAHHNLIDHLEDLEAKFKNQPFQIFIFPSGHGLTSQKLQDQYLIQRHSSFIVLAKSHSSGKHKGPLFRYLKYHSQPQTGKTIKGEFTRFLIEQNGHTIHRYSQDVTWHDLAEDIVCMMQKHRECSKKTNYYQDIVMDDVVQRNVCVIKNSSVVA